MRTRAIVQAWDERFNNNRLPHVFSDRVTGSIDTFPIYITRPPNALQRQYHNGKYGGHVLKVKSARVRTSAHGCARMRIILSPSFRAVSCQVQAVCDHSGNLMWYSGPHIGVTHDVRLFRENTPPLDRGEQLLGDKAYVGNPLLIALHKKVRGELSQRKRAFNVVHSWYRVTIEHCFAFVKR